MVRLELQSPIHIQHTTSDEPVVREHISNLISTDSTRLEVPLRWARPLRIDANVHVLLANTTLVLFVAKGAALFFVSTVTIDEDVAAERVFVFWVARSAIEAWQQNQERDCDAPRPLGLGEDPTWRRRSDETKRDVAIVSV